MKNIGKDNRKENGQDHLAIKIQQLPTSWLIGWSPGLGLSADDWTQRGVQSGSH